MHDQTQADDQATDDDYIYTEIDVITALDGREIDITEQVERLSDMGRYFLPGSELSPGGARYVHKIGWHLINICGAETVLDLAEDLATDGDVSPAFGALLRARWTEVAAKIQAAEESQHRWGRWAATQGKPQSRRR
jgi:hypothetical protein